MGVPKSDVKWLTAMAERLILVSGIKSSVSDDNGTHARKKESHAGSRHSPGNGRK
jgi:hypothetical protein